jgi:SRSO17 transposase
MSLPGIPVYGSTILSECGIANLSQETMMKKLTQHFLVYKEYIGRPENYPHFQTIIKGLMSDLERKNLQLINNAFNTQNELRNIYHFMRNSKLDDEGMLKEYQQEVAKLLSDKDGMITGDGCDFEKKGIIQLECLRNTVVTLVRLKAAKLALW